MRHGTDPINQRRAKRAEEASNAGLNTFSEVAAAYIAAHEASWRNTLDTYAAPVLGKLSVGAIGTAEVTRLLEPIWREKPETATRVRGRIEAVLDYATTLGWRTGENPARWRGHLANLLPSRAKLARVKHHAALPWQEVWGFMEALGRQDGMTALALRFTILTAARTGEVIGSRWAEVDMTNAHLDRSARSNEGRARASSAAMRGGANCAA